MKIKTKLNGGTLATKTHGLPTGGRGCG